VKARAAAIVLLVVAALTTLHPAGASHHGSHVVVPPRPANRHRAWGRVISTPTPRQPPASQTPAKS